MRLASLPALGGVVHLRDHHVPCIDVERLHGVGHVILPPPHINSHERLQRPRRAQRERRSMLVLAGVALPWQPACACKLRLRGEYRPCYSLGFPGPLWGTRQRAVQGTVSAPCQKCVAVVHFVRELAKRRR